MQELGEVKDRIEVEKVPLVITTTIIDMTIIIGEEAKRFLVEILSDNKEIEIPNIKVRIDRIGNGEIRMVKEGDIGTAKMTIIGSMDLAGKDIIIITGNNRIIIEAEATGGTRNKTMISKDSLTIPMVIMANTPNHNSYTMVNNPDLHSHNRQLIYVNCVTIKDTLITNVSLQVILWPELNKPLIRADNTTTKMDKANSLKGIMIMKTPVTSLFSKGGS